MLLWGWSKVTRSEVKSSRYRSTNVFSILFLRKGLTTVSKKLGNLSFRKRLIRDSKGLNKTSAADHERVRAT